MLGRGAGAGVGVAGVDGDPPPPQEGRRTTRIIKGRMGRIGLLGDSDDYAV
jgi:hypothetical protein